MGAEKVVSMKEVFCFSSRKTNISFYINCTLRHNLSDLIIKEVCRNMLAVLVTSKANWGNVCWSV